MATATITIADGPLPEQPPTPGDLVTLRGQKWVVTDTDEAPSNTLVTVQSVEDGHYDDTLTVIWEVEPGRRVLPSGALPEIARGMDFDKPEHLVAFLDAIRWSAATSADVTNLQAPFRSGVAIEDYQLEPLAKALDSPRVNLLLADDVGLGKTIEAGLVAQELILRHRGDRIMVICPAGLTIKWRDEMREKFGLDFTIIDSDRCTKVRQSHGSAANPFQVFPRTIVSLSWLRGPKAQRLLDDLLPAGGQEASTTARRFFDLLILDEAHHVAPVAPKQIYAVDSLQTKLIRRLAPHFTHRLFLSATPHNGYQESFTALLALLDDQRFARGVEPDKQAVREVVTRRLKSQIVDANGTPRFRRRQAGAIPVTYPQDERDTHALLQEFAQARARRLKGEGQRRAADLITLLLKKRLFSSPVAFARTLDVARTTLTATTRAGRLGDEDDAPDWIDEFEEISAYLDDEELATAEDDAVDRSGASLPIEVGQDSRATEAELLQRMHDWATGYEARPDAKATALIEHLKGVCLDRNGGWTDERIVVFTEYRATQDWLAELLRQHGLAGNRLGLLHGGIQGDEREQLRLGFQAAPGEHPIRILLATDAASEGIDLQNHCHRLINYDIPFNPNKLEQRIGRIDRYGQRHDPDVRHFVGAGWKGARDTLDADLEFLSRVARKVTQMESDLGPVNAVLAEAIQARMTGRRRRGSNGDAADLDVETAGGRRQNVPVDAQVAEKVRSLRARLDRTVEDLGITPRAVHRVVSTALTVARQQPLVPVAGTDGREFEVPPLTGSWQRAAAALAEKLRRPGQPVVQRPVTFDASVAAGRDDVVLAHLNHPLVAMSTRLLRGAASADDVDLRRVTAVLSDDPRVTEVIVAAYARFVLLGGDGIRLHEEVIHAGGVLPENGRFSRLEGLVELQEILAGALANNRPVSDPVRDRLVDRWERARTTRAGEGLEPAVRWRAGVRQASLATRLEQRRDAERARFAHNLDQFAATLRAKLAEDETEAEDALFSVASVTRSKDELAQYRRDRQSWQARLDQLDAEREREFAAIDERYRDPRPHLFPVATVFVVPAREATR